MRTLFDLHWLAIAFTSLVQLALFVRWLHRRIRSDEITRAFVEDIAMNHLPRIYAILERVCEQQGIDHPPLPAIHWVDLNRKSH
ncbi:MAG: hypothetical protein WAJ92_09345 [Candidatus Acidiferrales bacterium]